MSLSFLKPQKHDVTPLVAAIAANTRDDTLKHFLPQETWPVLADYLSPEDMQRGHVLISQGALDRTLYFIESGMLTVHFEDATGKIRLAAVGAGSVVGEGGFFSYMARSATVQAGSACKLWALTPMRLSASPSRTRVRTRWSSASRVRRWSPAPPWSATSRSSARSATTPCISRQVRAARSRPTPTTASIS